MRKVCRCLRNGPNLLSLLLDSGCTHVCAKDITWFASSMRTSSSPITSLAIFSRLLSRSKSPPTLNLNWWKPLLFASLSNALIFSSEYPSQLALVVYMGTARFCSTSWSLAVFPASSFFSNSTASSGVSASVMYRKSMHFTSSSGDMSATTFHTGFCSVFAHRSHRALTTADSARCMAPFSGPIHRTCPSETKYRQVSPQLEVSESSDRLTRSGARLLMAAQTTSFPRPIVKDYPGKP